MVTKVGSGLSVAQRAAEYLFPRGANGKFRHSLIGLNKTTAFTIVGAAAYVIPHLSDETVEAAFRKNLENVPYAETREFLTQILLMGKKLLGAKDYNKPALNLVNRIIEYEFEGVSKRNSFFKRYGFRPPGLIAISPSMRCNLRCSGCYAGEYSKKDDLPAGVLRRVIAEAKEIGIPFIVVAEANRSSVKMYWKCGRLILICHSWFILTALS